MKICCLNGSANLLSTNNQLFFSDRLRLVRCYAAATCVTWRRSGAANPPDWSHRRSPKEGQTGYKMASSLRP